MQEQFVAAWEHTRDHARPDGRSRALYERQADALADARDYGPKTDPKVRAKQIARRTRDNGVRKVSTTPAAPAPNVARLRHNQAAALGHEIARLLGYVKPIIR